MSSKLEAHFDKSVETPNLYEEHIDAWAGLLGAAGFANKTWRIATLIMFLVAAIGWGLFSYMAIFGQFRVAALRIDTMGRTAFVGSAEALVPGQPSNQQVAWFLREWVTWAKSVPNDQVVYNNNIRRAENFLTSDGLAIYQAEMRKDPPKERMSRGAVLVEVTGVHFLGHNEWAVDYTESEFRQGTITSKSPYTMRINTVFITPEGEEDLIKNPISTYIDLYSVTGSR